MNTEYFKQKLEEERGVVEGQLKELGRENPSVPGDWDATGGSLETMSPIQDSNEAADKLEEYGERREETNQLEIRLREINEALGKIEKGTYGVIVSRQTPPHAPAKSICSSLCKRFLAPER